MRSATVRVFVLLALLASGAYAARLLTDRELRTVPKLQKRRLADVVDEVQNSTTALLEFISNTTELSEIAKLVDEAGLYENFLYPGGTYFLPTDEAINASSARVAELYGHSFTVEQILDGRGILYHTTPVVLLPADHAAELAGTYNSYVTQASDDSSYVSLAVDLKFEESGSLASGKVFDEAGGEVNVIGMAKLSDKIVVYLIDQVLLFEDEPVPEMESNYTTVAEVLAGESSLTISLTAFNASGLLSSLNGSLANGTVFLPTDDAWTQFDSFLMDNLNTSLEQLTDEQYAAILGYHMVPDSPLQYGVSALPEDFNATLPTLLEGQNVTAALELLTVQGYYTLQVTDVYGNNARALEYFQLGDDVTVYIINGVLAPVFQTASNETVSNSTTPAANSTSPDANGTTPEPSDALPVANDTMDAEIASRRHRLF